jgi:hypothetical protein
MGIYKYYCHFRDKEHKDVPISTPMLLLCISVVINTSGVENSSYEKLIKTVFKTKRRS